MTVDYPVETLRQWILTGRLPRPATSGEREAVIEASREQGLLGLLATDIPEHDASWPAEARDTLRAEHRRLLARGVRQLDLLARVQGLLEAAGLRTIPLKGGALGETVYDSVADRPMGDVDLLVLEGWPDALRLLRDRGFMEVGRADHAAALADPEDAGILELHHSVTSCPGLFPLDPGLWARSRRGEGQVKHLPSTEDLVVHLSLHAAFQHGLSLSLIQYLDFRRIFERTPPDADRLRAAAAFSHAERALALALGAAAVVVGAPIPEALRLRDLAWPLEPRALVPPARPALARLRWYVASGRRGSLLQGTLAPALPGQVESSWRRGLRGLRRAGALLRRFPAGG